MRQLLQRVARMEAREIGCRGRTAVRTAWDRLRTHRAPPAWDRRVLRSALADDRTLKVVHDALEHEQWADAHRALAIHLTFTPQRFALAPSNRVRLSSTIRRQF